MCVNRYRHTLEGTLFDALNHSKAGIFVHWGAYESGKSTAVKGAAMRLQEESDRSVIFLQGYYFPWIKSIREWMRKSIGIPDFGLAQPMSDFFRKPTSIVIDHCDLLLREERMDEILKAVHELSTESASTQKFNVLLMVTSWERAIQLRDNGCNIVGSPSRWSRDELTQLFYTLPASVRDKWKDQDKNELLDLATLAGTPGFLTYVVSGGDASPERASILDMEWRKGTMALEGNSLPGDEGRFPDKNSIFHHKDIWSMKLQSPTVDESCEKVSGNTQVF
jgi:hypothetical protein